MKARSVQERAENQLVALDSQRKIIRELSPQYLGIEGAIAQIKKNLDKPAKIVPFKMPDAIFKTSVERGGKELEIQVELDECEYLVRDEDGYGTGEYDTDVWIIRAYTADNEMRDVELTSAEKARITKEYLASE